MVTLKEIAERCDVSATTVSNVINGKAKTSEETKQRILQVIDETGYKPNEIARGLRNKRSKIIGIVAEDIAQFTSPPIIESIMEYCEAKGYRAVVYNLRLYDRWSDTWYSRYDKYNSVVYPVLDDIMSAQVDGVVYVAGHARVIKTFNDVYDIPVVMCYAYSESSRVPSVVIDDENSTYEMVSYLIKNGHERIGFLGGQMENIHTGQRLMGYQRAMFENGLLFDPNLIYYGDWTRESGYKGAKELLKQNITALFSLSDRMTGGVYDYLYEKGLSIGKDISVASFDNESISSFFRPQLTTMELPLREIGRISAEQLLNKINHTEDNVDDKVETDVIKVPCELILRDSVYVR